MVLLDIHPINVWGAPAALFEGMNESTSIVLLQLFRTVGGSRHTCSDGALRQGHVHRGPHVCPGAPAANLVRFSGAVGEGGWRSCACSVLTTALRGPGCFRQVCTRGSRGAEPRAVGAGWGGSGQAKTSWLRDQLFLLQFYLKSASLVSDFYSLILLILCNII